MRGSALRSSFDLEGPGQAEMASKADLAIGMQLLRASNMKAVRLQLALMKRDREMAMEAVDSLIELDGQIASFIRDMPPEEVAMRELREISQWIDAEKRAIAAEKQILAEAEDDIPVGQRHFGLAGGFPQADNADDVEDEADLFGGESTRFEIGDKAIRAAIEARAFELEPDEPPAKALPSPAVLKDLTIIEARVRDIRASVAEVDERLENLPGKGFVLAASATAMVVIGTLILFADVLKSAVALSPAGLSF